MPPKGITPNLFGERKVFIGSIDGGKWWEFNSIANDKPLADEYYECDYKKETVALRKSYTMQCRLRPLKKKQKLLLFRVAGLLKSPKTTYKTLRHDCAKRNGRR